MKKIILGFLVVFSIDAAAQEYNSAIGLRGGLLNAVTYKMKLSDSSAGEGIASFQYEGLILTGLYTKQNPWSVEGAPLQWYYGAGAHVGFAGANYTSDNYNGGVILGIDGVIGMEHTFPKAPINISLDYKPAFNLIGINGLAFDGFSLGIRYVLN